MSIVEIFKDIEYKSLIEKLESLKKEGDDFKYFENHLYDLKTARKLLDNMLYFMMIQGRLKTGKSTLINILADKKVAITKIDNDTTKVPYIITYSKEETLIVKYEAISSIPDDKYDSVFKSILNDIIGVKIEDVDIDEKKYFIKIEEKFNLSKLKKYTTEDNNNILLINIKVKPEHNQFDILSKNIAIVDTPGIGGSSYKKEKNLISCIREKVDMLILLQSTLTPFDEVLLEELDTFSSDINLRLLHNSFELKPWATQDIKDELQKDENSLILKAKNQILKNSRKKDVPVFAFNFGKIEDYIVFNNLRSKLEDEFEKYINFKNNMVEYIKKNRQKDREFTVKRNIKNVFDNIDLYLNKLIQQYEYEHKNVFEKKEDIKRNFENYKKTIKNEVSNINFELSPFLLSDTTLNIFRECFFANERLLNDIRLNFIHKIVYDVVKNFKKIRNEEIDSFMKNLNGCLNEKLINYLTDKLNEHFDYLCKDIIEKLDLNVKSYYHEQSLPKFNFQESDSNKIILDVQDHYRFLKNIDKIKENLFEYLNKELKNKLKKYESELKRMLENKSNEYLEKIDEIESSILSLYDEKYISQKNYYENILNSLYFARDKLSLLRKKYNLI